MGTRESRTILQRFFAGLAEYTFQVRLGVVDPPMIDYLSRLLIRFIRYDQLHKVRNPAGRPLKELDRMIQEAEARIGMARRQVHRHIGDYALFWAGLFPESLRRKRGPAELDWYNNYCAHGKRAYLIASTIETDDEQDAPNELLERLGQQFEMCAYGLREVRRQWEQGEKDERSGPFLIN